MFASTVAYYSASFAWYILTSSPVKAVLILAVLAF